MDLDLSEKGSAAALAPRPPTICILSLSAIADDPRVRRQADAFHRAGWKVVAVGLPGARSAAPAWPILTADRPLPSIAPEPQVAPIPERRSAPRRWIRRSAKGGIGLLRRIMRFGRVRYGLRLLAVRVRPALALPIYWSFSENIRHIYDCAREMSAEVWLANDWTILPVAARLACERGGIYGYDTHEFATEEYGDQRKWRLWHRPMVRALEHRFIQDAAVVSAVSAGIAEGLDRLYRRSRPCLVIRNTPGFEAHAFRPTSSRRIRVLYHGILTPGRGLEAAIDSVALWRPEFELTIRGLGGAAYLAKLRERIDENGLSARVTIAPPVPMVMLVREAAAHDIGFFALPATSRHNEFALPNKFFEYLMAGLALCITDLPEMARLLHQLALGVTFSRVEPRAIAAAVNGFDPAAIDRCKQNALRAARELCWERESEHLVGAYAALVANR